jgi:mRNA interferase MazF
MVRRGEIYIVSFDPARGVEQRGTRPALVIQSDSGNEFANSTIVAAMSTSASADYLFRVEVGPENSGLREASTIMLDQITTISLQRLKEPVGQVSSWVMEEVDSALKYSLGLVG